MSTSPINQATRAAAVTPSDVTVLEVTQGLYVGVGGNVALILAGDTVAVTFKNVAQGAIMPVAATKVMSTNTTATDLVALYNRAAE